MRRASAGMAILAASCLLAGCGYKTHPRPATAAVPGEIGLVDAHAYPNQVVLKWDIPRSNADGSQLKDLGGFKVFRSSRRSGEACPDCDKAANLHASVDYRTPTNAEIVGNEVTYTDDRTSPGNVYFYAVSAYNDRGREGAKTSTVTVAVEEVPPAPRGLRSEFDKTGIILNWEAPDAPAGIRTYKVYRGDSSDPRDMKSVGGTRWAENSFVDKQVEKDKTYYYVVRSMKMSGGVPLESEPSQAVRAVFPKVQWDSPENVKVVATSQGIRVAWDKVQIPKAETRYNVYRSEEGKPFTRINPRPLANAWINDANVKKGRQYRYSVKAFPEGRPDEESRPSTSEAVRNTR
ncbi:MAG: fibronectin type III domain-containing protein [Thermodesulfobacteriota bacterium]